MCGKAVVYVSCLLNPSVESLRIPCASAQGESMFVRIEVHSLSMPFISAIGDNWLYCADLFCSVCIVGRWRFCTTPLACSCNLP